MLRPDFLSYSPGSRRLIDFEEAGEEPLLVDEIERATAEHRKAAPGRVARGTLTQDEADRIGAVLAAIAADLSAELAFFAHLRRAGAPTAGLAGTVAGAHAYPLPRAGDAFSWEDKLHVLRREIHFRRKYDPDRIARGRLAPADARTRLERIEAVQDKYWRCLFAWRPPVAGAWNPAHPDYRSPGAEAYRAAVREHAATLELAARTHQAEPAADVSHEEPQEKALPL